MHYNCLIVDDEIELAKMTAEYFQMFDISTEYVDSAAACYDFLEKNDIDLLLLDINLGDGSGFEVFIYDLQYQQWTIDLYPEAFLDK